tara:strand:- start:443 stop:1339 length:897 start_codon:yes stop_codon:yes gene_type:complete
MVFINNLKVNIIKSYNNKPSNKLIVLLNNNINNNNNNNFANKPKIYNPIIGSNLGIPLNILQLIFTTSYYNKNIVDLKLIFLQFAIGIFTYGSDRLFDAYEYNKTLNTNINITEIYSEDKIQYYDYIIKNFDFSSFSIIASYIYILSVLILQYETYPIISLLSSTIFYKEFKQNYGYLKALYIGIFWTIGCVILPCVLYDQNYEILNHPLIYMPCFLTMFASSNILDIKDVDEDKSENINTLPVLYGENTTISISHFAIALSIILFAYNENFNNNIYYYSLYELQNFGLFFINYNKTS